MGDRIIRPMVEEYTRRRELMMEMADRAGLSYFPPRGAFYLWLRHGVTRVDGWALVDHLLDRHGVAITPGEIFGPSGKGYLRISYSNSMENLRKGMARIIETLNDLKK
jgi:aspartate/methionine/tyrosine aminotransferase